MMKISVIIPVYNIKNYLFDCIYSILEQTYKNIEVIIIDDGSSDGSENICDQFALKDPRIKVHHKFNSGVSDSRNIGISLATGDYICFIDGDDFIENDYFEKAVSILNEYNPKILINTYKLYYGVNNIVEPFKKDKTKYLSKNEFLKGIFIGKLFNWSPVCKFFHSSIINKLKFDKEYCYGEDLLFIYDLINKMSSSDAIVYAPLSSYMYVQRKTSACYSYSVEKKYDCVKIYEHIIETADKEIAEYVYNNLYLRSLIRLRYRMLQCNYDKNSLFYVNCNTIPRRNFFKVLFSKNMKLKPRVLFLLNFLPDYFFKIVMSALIGIND